MRKLTFLLFPVCAVALALQVAAQPPRGRPGDRGKAKPQDTSDSPLVTRMMAFDKNKDGKLTKEEVTDERLHRLFDRADANKDGVVTKAELVTLAAKMEGEFQERGGRGGPGGPGRGRPGGPGGPGGFGGPPRPGQILPPFLAERLRLTADQKKQLDALQKEVDRKLDKILTAEQKKQLKEMRPGFGPGGPGGRGPGGRGPGGPPPGEERGRPGRPGGDRPPE